MYYIQDGEYIKNKKTISPDGMKFGKGVYDTALFLSGFYCLTR